MDNNLLFVGMIDRPDWPTSIRPSRSRHTPILPSRSRHTPHPRHDESGFPQKVISSTCQSTVFLVRPGTSAVIAFQFFPQYSRTPSFNFLSYLLSIYSHGPSSGRCWMSMYYPIYCDTAFAFDQESAQQLPSNSCHRVLVPHLLSSCLHQLSICQHAPSLGPTPTYHAIYCDTVFAFDLGQAR
jgi:hypothetical protein